MITTKALPRPAASSARPHRNLHVPHPDVEFTLHHGPARRHPLRLDVPSQAGRGAFISSGSGILQVGRFVYVVADDELHLGVFPAQGRTPGKLLRLLPGDLPLDKDVRKAVKPDFEAITKLPPFREFPNGALLVFGSGSRPERMKAVLVPLGLTGEALSKPRVLDLKRLYEALKMPKDSLNIEAATVAGNKLLLFQRGNQHVGNQVIQLDLARVLDSVSDGRKAVPPSAMIGKRNIEIGKLGGVRLGISGASALQDGRVLFTASAEDTNSTYLDGAVTGSILGLLERDGKAHVLGSLGPQKIEGVHAQKDGTGYRLSFVTDADDGEKPSLLLSAKLTASIAAGAPD